MVTKKQIKKEIDSKPCSKCKKDKKLNDYYMAANDIINSDHKLSICKACLSELINFNDRSSLISILRMIDRPFLYAEYEGTMANKNKANFGEYMRRLGMPQNKYLTFADSEFSEKMINQIENSDSDEIEVFEITEDVISHWGKGHQDWEYKFLEDQNVNLKSSFECPDYGMEMIMKDICFINLDIEKLRQEKNPANQKIITTLIETRSKLMNSANMNPIQATGAEANDQITFGTLIKKWENDRPVPKPLDDEMKEYIDTYMVGHLAKMEGLNNEMTEKYDQALSSHTISFNELNRDEEEFGD